MIATRRTDYDYRFFNEKRYLHYLEDNPKPETKKINGIKRVRTVVVINLKGLKAELIRNALTLNPAWVDSREPNPTGTGAYNPSVVVVPMMKASEGNGFVQMRAKMESSPFIRYVVNNVSKSFLQNDYKTRDFITMIENGTIDNLIRQGTQTDTETMIVQQLPGDIVVTVDTDTKINAGNNSGRVTLNIRAIEKQTGVQMIIRQFVGEYYSTDSTYLAQLAITEMNPGFFAEIKESFEKVVQNGRNVVLHLTLSETLTDWDFDQDSPVTGDYFKDALDEWLRSNSFQGKYDMSNNTDKYISISIHVPLWNNKRNRTYTLSNFQSDLRKFFKSQLGEYYKASITAMGQKCSIVIE